MNTHMFWLGITTLANLRLKPPIESALSARAEWAGMEWNERAAIFLKAAELLAGPYRQRLNAATMLCQSKNVFQAEIDAACELVDFQMTSLRRRFGSATRPLLTRLRALSLPRIGMRLPPRNAFY
jgi:acyl-CoA reductase-like NAD-dependent aldehyde dehydrogenase